MSKLTTSHFKTLSKLSIFEGFKTFRSENYNYNFDLNTGYFERWGKTKENDPEIAPFPEILDIEISTICHKGCKFCYKSNTTDGTYMKFETFKKMFDKFPKTLTQIAFGIGDLDSNPDLYQIMKYCRDNDVIPNITINGDDLTEFHIQNLVKYAGAVAVSCYEFNTCFTAVNKLTYAGLKQVNIHMLLSEDTLDKCMDLMIQSKHNLKLEKLNAIVFLWLKPKGRGEELKQIQSMESYKYLINYAFDNNIRIGFDSCSASNFVKAVKDKPNFEQLNQMVDSCESTLFSYYIDVHGKGFPCSFSVGTSGLKGVNVLKAKNFINDVWNHPETTFFRTRLLANKDCNGCRKCPIYNLEVK